MDVPRKTRVLIIDAEAVSRRGLIHLLSDDPGLRVCGETGTSNEARELCEKLQPEVVVIDPAMDGGSGFALLKELPRWAPKTQVVVFTSLEDGLSIQRAFRAGVVGYVTRRDSAPSLLAAIAWALVGHRHVAPRVSNQLLARLASGAMEMRRNEESELTERELQIYKLIGEGRSSREMAGQLFLSVKTIETHRQRIKRKLGLANATALQRRAMLFAEVEPVSGSPSELSQGDDTL